MTTTAAHMTAEDLLNLPGDNSRHELVRGELITMPPTSGEHGVSTFNIAGLLRTFIKQNDLGVGAGAETGFLISRNPDTVRAPDCAFVRKDRIPAGGIPKKFRSRWHLQRPHPLQPSHPLRASRAVLTPERGRSVMSSCVSNSLGSSPSG